MTELQDRDLILHILPRKDWEKARRQGEYRAASLESEGFIHYSRPDQILGVANHYFSGVEDLVLLWIDPGKMASELRLERSGDQLFPHGYGSLNLEAVVGEVEISSDPDGIFRKFLRVDGRHI